MKRLVPVFALLVAISAAMLLVLRHRGEAPAEGTPAAKPAVTEKAPPAGPAPTPEEPAKKAPKRRGIVVSSFEEGSKVDPNAPPSELAKYEALRNAELARWEVKMDLSFENRSLRDILTDILRDYGLKASIDPGCDAEKAITFMTKDLFGKHCLKLLLQQYDLKWVIDEHGESWVVPEEKCALYEPEAWRSMVEMQEIEKTLAAEDSIGVVPDTDRRMNNAMDSITVSLNFTDTPLPEVLDFISELTQFNVMIDRRHLDAPEAMGISLKVENAPVRDALKTMSDAAGVGFTIHNGVLVITSKDEIERLAAAESTLAEARVAAVKEEAGILDKSVTLTGEYLAIREVADLVSKATGIGYVIDTPTWNRAARISFDGEPHTLREIFAAMSSGAPVRAAYRDGKFWFLDRPAPATPK